MEKFFKNFNESREISIGTMGIGTMGTMGIGTMENGKSSMRNLMKVEKYL